MKTLFCGVGEAFDENLPNTSILVRAKNNGATVMILLDCGFTAAPAYWRLVPDPLELDAVWISHLHGDHFLGLPQLLIRISEHGRSRPLQLGGGPDTFETVKKAMELAYPGKWDRLGFEIIFEQAYPGAMLQLAGVEAVALPVEHAVPCLGIKFISGGKTLFYSGDGRLQQDAWLELQGCDFAICEAFTLKGHTAGHNSAEQVASMVRAADIRQAALVHMQRGERRRHKDQLQSFLHKEQVQGFMPEPGEAVEI